MRNRIWAATATAFAALMLWAVPASAAPFAVDDLSDVDDAVSNDGICDATGGDTCTLRAALDEANFTAASDTISITVPGTINLALGQLGISFPTIVNGNASGTTVDAGDAGRVLTVSGSPTTLNDLVLQNGATTDNDGAGIQSVATLLTLNRVTVTSNTLTTAGGGAGAGIRTFSPGQSLVLNDSTVSDNTITGVSGLGAGIRAGGPVALNRSTVSGNSTTLDPGGRGGGIDMTPASAVALTISNSTVSDNHSGGDAMGNGGGGGVFVGGGNVTTSIVGSTIAGNTTAGLGGGVSHAGSAMALSENTIYAANTAAAGNPNCSIPGTTLAENNVDTGISCAFGTSSGNQENVSPAALGLGALASNGGPTQTRAIASGSVAQNAASGDCGGLGTDQRGVLRPQGTSCDIGSFELEVFTPPPPGGGSTTPATPTPKKCKKGQKLKKGKCVKKKRKKG